MKRGAKNMSLVFQRKDAARLPPPRDFEVFVNNIPLSVSEQELTSMFEKYGNVYTLHLVARSSRSKNYAFVRFTEKSSVREAVLRWNAYEIRRGHRILVSRSVENKSLVLCSVPRELSPQDIYFRIGIYTTGLQCVDTYPPRNGKGLNSGIAYLSFENHTAASIAKKVLSSLRHRLWNNLVHIDWHTPGLITDERAVSLNGGEGYVPLEFYSAQRAEMRSQFWATSSYSDISSETVLYTEISTPGSPYGNGFYWSYGDARSSGSNRSSCNF